MTPDGRLTVILAAIGLVAGLVGWLVRQMIAGMRDEIAAARGETKANTEAMALLTSEFSQFRIQLAERSATEARAEADALRAQSPPQRGRHRFLV
jgi:hypothetical protein